MTITETRLQEIETTCFPHDTRFTLAAVPTKDGGAGGSIGTVMPSDPYPICGFAEIDPLGQFATNEEADGLAAWVVARFNVVPELMAEVRRLRDQLQKTAALGLSADGEAHALMAENERLRKESSAIIIIAAACDKLRDNGHCHSPRIVDRDSFDLSKFTAQASDIPGVETEYVDQRGPGISGDDFHGTMAFPIGDKLFVVGYST